MLYFICSFEKYLGGHFLGEILRFALLELTENGLLFNGVVNDQLRKYDFIKTSHLSSIEG